MTNHWVATWRDSFACWTVKGGCESFLGDLAKIGDVTAAWKVSSVGEYSWEEGSSLTGWLTTHSLPTLRDLVASARLSWWDDGLVREGEVAHLGALLRRLRPDTVGRGSMYMQDVGPITINGPVNHLQVTLHTDIWFPWIRGLLDGWLDDELKTGLPFDNRALAERHTPALNAFLSEARSLALSSGLTWELDEPEGVALHYADWVREDGIRLS